MVDQKESLRKQLELDDKKRQDITPFYDQAYKIQEQMYHAQVNLTQEINKVRLMMTRLKVIVEKSLDFKKGLLEVTEKVKIQLN